MQILTCRNSHFRKELQEMLKLQEEQQAMESVGEKYGGKYHLK